jgi:hypothetical protein
MIMENNDQDTRLLNSSNMSRNILNGGRILDGKAMTLALYSRFINQYSTICGQT